MLSEASRIFFSNSREKNGLNAADRLRKYSPRSVWPGQPCAGGAVSYRYEFAAARN